MSAVPQLLLRLPPATEARPATTPSTGPWVTTHMQAAIDRFTMEFPGLPQWLVERSVVWAKGRREEAVLTHRRFHLSHRAHAVLSAYEDARRKLIPILHAIDDNPDVGDRLRDKIFARIWDGRVLASGKRQAASGKRQAASGRTISAKLLAKQVVNVCGPYCLSDDIVATLRQLRAGVPYQRLTLYQRETMIRELTRALPTWTLQAVEAVVEHVEQRNSGAPRSKIIHLLMQMDQRLRERIDPYLAKRFPAQEERRRTIHERIVRHMLTLSQGQAGHAWQTEYLIAFVDQFIARADTDNRNPPTTIASAVLVARIRVAAAIARIVGRMSDEFNDLPLALIRTAVTVTAERNKVGTVQPLVRIMLQRWQAQIDTYLKPWIAAYYPHAPWLQETALHTCLQQIAAMNAAAFVPGNSIWYPRNLRALVDRECEK